MSPSGTFATDDTISSPKIWSSVLAFYFSSPSDNTLSALDKASCCVTLLLLGRFREFLDVEAFLDVLASIKPEPELLRFKLLVDWWAVKPSFKKDRLSK